MGKIAACLMIVLAALPPAPRSQDSSKEITSLIEGLGDDSLDRRQEAQERLMAIGEPALPALELARADPDPERACRAETVCLVIRRRIRFAKMTADPDLRKKLDGFRESHPGQAVIVSRVHEYVDHLYIPVRKLGAGLFVESLEGADKGKRFTVKSEPSDEAGELFFWIAPGKYKVISASHDTAYSLDAKDAVWRWNGIMDREFTAKEIVFLPEMEFVAPLQWDVPEDVTRLDIKANPTLSWKPYPEVVSVKVQVQRGATDYLGSVKIDGASGRRVDLSRLLNVNAGIPLVAGNLIVLRLTGEDAGGRLITTSPGRTFTLGE